MPSSRLHYTLRNKFSQRASTISETIRKQTKINLPLARLPSHQRKQIIPHNDGLRGEEENANLPISSKGTVVSLFIFLPAAPNPRLPPELSFRLRTVRLNHGCASCASTARKFAKCPHKSLQVGRENSLVTLSFRSRLDADASRAPGRPRSRWGQPWRSRRKDCCISHSCVRGV